MPGPKAAAFERAFNRDAITPEHPLIALSGALRGIKKLDAACRDLHPMFDYQLDGESVEDRDARHKTALKVCAACPALAACKAESRRSTHSGVIAGRVVRERAEAITRSTARLLAGHGTEAAAKRHYRNGELPCEACRVGAMAARAIRRQGKDGFDCDACGRSYADAKGLARHRAGKRTAPECRVPVVEKQEQDR